MAETYVRTCQCVTHLFGCMGGWEGCCSVVVVLTLKGHQTAVISHKLACELPRSDARLTGAGCCTPHTVQVWKQGTVSPNLLSFLLLLTLLLMSRHASCNDIHDATPTCCMTHPHYIPPTPPTLHPTPQVNLF